MARVLGPSPLRSNGKICFIIFEISKRNTSVIKLGGECGPTSEHCPHLLCILFPLAGLRKEKTFLPNKTKPNKHKVTRTHNILLRMQIYCIKRTEPAVDIATSGQSVRTQFWYGLSLSLFSQHGHWTVIFHHLRLCGINVPWFPLWWSPLLPTRRVLPQQRHFGTQCKIPRRRYHHNWDFRKQTLKNYNFLKRYWNTTYLWL